MIVGGLLWNTWEINLLNREHGRVNYEYERQNTFNRHVTENCTVITKNNPQKTGNNGQLRLNHAQSRENNDHSRVNYAHIPK